MARSTCWRRAISDALSWYQDQALSTNIFILREYGPTGFLLKEDGQPKPVKAYLGDPHKCSCKVNTSEHELCKHLCWILLKKFKLDRNNPSFSSNNSYRNISQISWQYGLVEHEINAILKSCNNVAVTNAGSAATERQRINDESEQDVIAIDYNENKAQRLISEEDICPICQEVFLEKRQVVTYCKQGCGNNIHVMCMKIWADHQRNQETNPAEVKDCIKCPMCRMHFGSYRSLLKEYASIPRRKVTNKDECWFTCTRCSNGSISSCYRCCECTNARELCESCFLAIPGHSQKHQFQIRMKSNQNWKFLNNSNNDDEHESIYDKFEKPSASALLSLHKEQLRKGHRLLEGTTKAAQQCRLCLRPYMESEVVSKLPECHHKFHQVCLNEWMTNQRPCCPLDGAVFSSDHLSSKSIRSISKAKHLNKCNDKDKIEFVIPGIGLYSNSNDHNSLAGSAKSNISRELQINKRSANLLRRNSNIPFVSASPLPAIGSSQSPSSNGTETKEKKKLSKAGKAAIKRELNNISNDVFNSVKMIQRRHSSKSLRGQSSTMNRQEQWGQQTSNNLEIIMIGNALSDNK